MKCAGKPSVRSSGAKALMKRFSSQFLLGEVMLLHVAMLKGL
jgi:hypothetical protein